MFKSASLVKKQYKQVDSRKLIERLEHEELQMLEKLKLTQKKEIATIHEL